MQEYKMVGGLKKTMNSIKERYTPEMTGKSIIGVILITIAMLFSVTGSLVANPKQSHLFRQDSTISVILEIPGLFKSVEKLYKVYGSASEQQWADLLQSSAIKVNSGNPHDALPELALVSEARIYELGGLMLADMGSYTGAVAFLTEAFNVYRQAGYHHVLGDLLRTKSALHANYGYAVASQEAEAHYTLWRTSLSHAMDQLSSKQPEWPFAFLPRMASTMSLETDKKAGLLFSDILSMLFILALSLIIIGFIRSSRSHDKLNPSSLQLNPVSLNFRKLLSSLGSSNLSPRSDEQAMDRTTELSDSPDFYSNDRIASLYEQIKLVIAEEKLYTNRNLSISYLAAQLGTNDRYISQAINTHSQHNFSGFINRYRVDAACELFEKNESLSIQQIASRCGFGSMSSFHRIFKEIMCVTPYQYQKSLYMKRVREKMG